MSRLRYDNPARIILLGEPNIETRRRNNSLQLYKQMEEDLSLIIDDDKLINLMNKNFRDRIKKYRFY